MAIEGSGKLQSIDKLNSQRLIENFAQRFQKLDSDERKLEEVLVNFSIFLNKETPKFDLEGKPILVPYQFLTENRPIFKKFEIPISRATWVVPKVVLHMRLEIERYERGMPNMASAMPLLSPPNTNVEAEGVSSKLIKSFKEITTKLYKDPLSPKTKMEYTIARFQAIPEQWHNMLHIYNVNFDKRPHLSQRAALDRTLSHVKLVFDSYLSPALVALVRYAIEITKDQTLDRYEKLLVFQQQLSERHDLRQPFLPQPSN